MGRMQIPKLEQRRLKDHEARPFLLVDDIKYIKI